MSKRPLDLEGAVTTPSKKATVRRAQTANKRSVDEVHEDSLASKKKSKAVDDDDEVIPSTTRKAKPSVSEEQKTSKKTSTRRNTERLSSLLEAKNIIPSPVANKPVRSFADEENGSDEDEDRPVSAKKPRSRKSLQPKTPEPRRIEVLNEETLVAEIKPIVESVPPQRTDSVLDGENHDYNNASLKVPSTQELRDNDATGELAGFWTQCREALSFCCATLYPSFLTVIVLAYLLHFVTNQRVFASFAVIFTILSGMVLGFFFVSVVPFVVVLRTVERYLQEKDKDDSVFVNLLVRIGLLVVCFGTLTAVQYLAQ